MSNRITKADLGVAIPVDLGEDITGYSTKQLRLKAPDGTLAVVSCAQDPDNNCQMLLTILSTTFQQSGVYIAQPQLTEGGTVIHGREFEIPVDEILTSDS